MTRRSRARARPSPPPPLAYDLGSPTEAATRGTTVEPVPDDANGRKRRRRRSPWLYEPLSNSLDAAQANAADALSEAWEATQTSPPAIQEVRVDTCLNPSAIIAQQIARASAFSSLYCAVPAELRPVVEHVVLEGRAIRDGYARDGHKAARALTQLRAGLDKVAKRMRQK